MRPGGAMHPAFSLRLLVPSRAGGWAWGHG